MNRRGTWVRCLPPIFLAFGGLAASGVARPQASPPPAPAVPTDRDVVPGFVDRYCSGCHNGEDRTAGLDLDAIGSEDIDRHPEAWEKVVRKLVARQMPPPRRS